MEPYRRTALAHSRLSPAFDLSALGEIRSKPYRYRPRLRHFDPDFADFRHLSALGTLFATEKEGAAWLRGPHKATVFSGKPPIELMTTGMQDDLCTTRRYLDAATMGYFGSPNEADRDFKPYTDSEISFS